MRDNDSTNTHDKYFGSILILNPDTQSDNMGSDYKAGLLQFPPHVS